MTALALGIWCRAFREARSHPYIYGPYNTHHQEIFMRWEQSISVSQS